MFVFIFENILYRLLKKLKNVFFDVYMKIIYKWNSWKLNFEFWN